MINVQWTYGASMGTRSDIDIQDRTFKFGVRIIKFVGKLPRTLSATELGKQLLRSGTSIAANMEEANGAESRSDFIHKVSIAYKEARESRMWLGMIKAAILPNASEVQELYTECDEIVRILFAILRKARSNRTAPKPSH
jgi:four helix bundle protein